MTKELLAQDHKKEGIQCTIKRENFEEIWDKTSIDGDKASNDIQIEENETLWEKVNKSLKTRQRWGRKEDILLFKCIYMFEKKGVISLKEILHMSPEYDENNEGISQLCDYLGWKSAQSCLITRIQKRINNEFSHRETKLLKRLCKRNYKKIDYEDIFYYFPGKTFQIVSKACDIICENKKRKNVSNVDVNHELKNYFNF